MKTNMTFIVAVGFAICSCGNGRGSGSSDEITGAYSREYSFKVLNPETGNEVGMQTIRDTIFIRASESGYQVSNRKWKLNDYDKEGWRNMEHSDDRPILTVAVIYNQRDQTLSANSSIILFFDRQSHSVRRQSKKENLFKKI